MRVESSQQQQQGAAASEGRDERAEELRRALAQAGPVLASLADGVIVKDHRNTIAWANEAAAAIFASDSRAMLGISATDPAFDPRRPDGTPFAPEDLPSSRALATGAAVLGVVLDLARADGSRVHVEMSTKPLRTGDGPAYGAVTVVRDVSARIAETEAVRFQAALLDAVGQAVVATDAQRRITYWNRAATETYGWSAEEVLGRDLVALTAAPTSGAELLAISDALGGGRSWTGEVLVRDRDERIFPALVTSRPLLAPDGSLRGVIGVSMDVSEGKRSERETRRLSAIVASSADAILSVTVDGRIDSWNDAAAALFGYAAEEAVGLPVDVLAAGEHRETLLRLHHDAVLGLRSTSVAMVWRTRDGVPVDVSVTVSAVPDARGEVIAVSAIARDVREQRALQRALEHQATHDSLTGLANRAALHERLGSALARERAAGRAVGVLFVDLDLFKSVNDAVGHRAGDEVLVEVAQRLSTAVGEEGLVARLGGDEFVVVLEDTDAPAAHRCADRVAAAMRHPVVREGRRHYVTASIGVALSPPADAEELLARADAAMFQAKAAGRDRVGTSPEGVVREVRERVGLASELREALETDGLALHYQPIVELATGALVGLEALCRWTHPELGTVPPDRFVAVAEAIGLSGALDRWVLHRAAADARTLVERGLLGPEARVAVNLSAQSIDAGLEDLVLRVVEDAGVPYDALALEVTETGVMVDPEAAAATLRRLRERGIGVHIDDFGTGYSSLSYLRRLPISGIKIDRSFVKDLTTEPDDLAITVSIIDLSRSLGVRTIAEGVETQEQLDLLGAHGCWAGQGYLWSPAVPLPALVELLQRTRELG